jgi:hypothetical protein
LRAPPREHTDNHSNDAGNIAPVLMPPLRQSRRRVPRNDYEYTLMNRDVTAAAMLNSNGT